MDGASGIPEWVLWIGAALGSMIGALVIRLGWKSGGGEKHTNETSFTLDAALVDSSSIRKLTAAIEAHTLECITARVEKAKRLAEKERNDEKVRQALYRSLEIAANASKEIQELNATVRQLTTELIRRDSKR